MAEVAVATPYKKRKISKAVFIAVSSREDLRKRTNPQPGKQTFSQTGYNNLRQSRFNNHHAEALNGFLI
jgi:hypothetical protein